MRISPIVIACFTHPERSAATRMGEVSVLGFGFPPVSGKLPPELM